MRVPLESYLRGPGAKVYSLVVGVPFSPIDIDLGRLARGEWNASTDRFRIWYLPREDGADDGPVCYVMVRKFDLQGGVLLYGHFVVNIDASSESHQSFTVGIMSNDEARARSMLDSTLDIPPSHHRMDEVRLVESRWRRDPDAVMSFLANVHSAMAESAPDPGREAYTLKFDPPPGMMGELRRDLGAWW